MVGNVSVTLTSMFLSISPQQLSLNLISTRSTLAFEPRTSANQGNGALSTTQNVKGFESLHSWGGLSTVDCEVNTPRDVSLGKAQARVPETFPSSDFLPESELFTQHFLLP